MITGDDYLKSLDDGRVLHIDGRRIDDVVTDPLTRVPAASVAAGYDAVAAGLPPFDRPLLAPPTTPLELRAAVDALTHVDMLAHTTFTSAMSLRTVAPALDRLDPVSGERARSHVDRLADEGLRVATCITDAKGDRSRHPGEQGDPESYLAVVDRTSDGVVLRGAKLHITGAALAHELFVMPTKKMRAGEERFAVACAVPVNAPGVTILNTSYQFRGADDRSHPISSRRQMPEGFVVFDDVFVPWDRVFLDGQVEMSARFAHAIGLWERLGSIADMAHDADLMVGLAQLAAEANGLTRVEHVRQKISEIVIYATLVRSGLEAAIANTASTSDGNLVPDELFTNAAKYHGAAEFGLMARHLIDIAGGAVATAPAIADLESPETGAYVRRYMAGSPGFGGEDRLRVLHAVRDFVADSYGGWRAVTTLHGGGGLHAQRLVARFHYPMAEALALARDAAGLSPA
ncbi:4-hydroxyphenylacetate 3-hydroxylase N-terminal domain-containing protein [Pseudonocardia xishanensis]|uniref:4-hydroxyphenylacetate 3-hydroxylase N-terminal domain-containing protein n=1 Tax=Pseudonocardia xishanensis TaxID=630995 RepID=A0ABP8RZB1_9PSEU